MQSLQACPSCLSWGHTSSAWLQNHLLICTTYTETQAYPNIYKQFFILSLGNFHLRLHLCLCAPDMSSKAGHVARVTGLGSRRLKAASLEPKPFTLAALYNKSVYAGDLEERHTFQEQRFQAQNSFGCTQVGYQWEGHRPQTDQQCLLRCKQQRLLFLPI